MSTAARPRTTVAKRQTVARSDKPERGRAASRSAALTARAAVRPPAGAAKREMRAPSGALGVEDVQSHADTRRIPINRVGIKDIHHPVRVRDRSRGEQHTVASFNMYVNLPHNFKGTHMSRFVEILHHEREISVDSFRGLLMQMAGRLDANAGHIEMSFPYFITKRAPVSGVESLMDYQASLIGEVRDGETCMWLKVVVPVTSLCPCSKKISERGAHNQRSHVTIKARLASHMWIEELIDIAESEASCELYGILKRPDEKYVTERAYDNPKFVEDMVRDVAVRLNREERILAYVVESENFESIHNHSAYALIECEKQKNSA
jgi:GTP cyclohydrolase IB